MDIMRAETSKGPEAAGFGSRFLRAAGKVEQAAWERLKVIPDKAESLLKIYGKKAVLGAAVAGLIVTAGCGNVPENRFPVAPGREAHASEIARLETQEYSNLITKIDEDGKKNGFYALNIGGKYSPGFKDASGREREPVDQRALLLVAPVKTKWTGNDLNFIVITSDGEKRFSVDRSKQELLEIALAKSIEEANAKGTSDAIADLVLGSGPIKSDRDGVNIGEKYIKYPRYSVENDDIEKAIRESRERAILMPERIGKKRIGAYQDSLDRAKDLSQRFEKIANPPAPKK